jgi:hypothetical protein
LFDTESFPEMKGQLQDLWRESAIQQVYQRASEFSIQETVE